MSKFREKAQGRTKQLVGQMTGDDELVREGKQQEERAENQDRAESQDRSSSSQTQK
jgi:uncharacterized protein YjbJ (UPF0337 family)